MSTLTDSSIGTGKQALVVDDEPIVGHIMCQVLEQMGYCVDHALDGQQALDLTDTRPYDIVVCDILMPRTNGMALYEVWQERSPAIAERTIFVTGDSLGAETQDFVARSGCPCIYKPFKLSDLAVIISRMQAQADQQSMVGSQ